MKYLFLPVLATVSVQRHEWVFHIWGITEDFNTWGYNLEMEHWPLSKSLSNETQFGNFCPCNEIKGSYPCHDTRPKKQLHATEISQCWLLVAVVTIAASSLTHLSRTAKVLLEGEKYLSKKVKNYSSPEENITIWWRFSIGERYLTTSSLLVL